MEILRYWSSGFKESVMILVRGAAPACMLATWAVGICGAKWRAVFCLDYFVDYFELRGLAVGYPWEYFWSISRGESRKPPNRILFVFFVYSLS